MKRKIVCIVLSLIVVCANIGLSIQAAETPMNELDTDASNSVRVIEKDMLTGSVNHHSYEIDTDTVTSILDEASENSSNNINENFNVRSVIGEDGRVPVSTTTSYPYSAIAYIETHWKNGRTSIGTAWMIGDNSLATAGHNLYDAENGGGWATSVDVYPGKDGWGAWNNPYGTATSTRIVVSADYVETDSDEYDWGFIEIDEDLGLQTGTISFAYCEDTFIDNTVVTICGYIGEDRYHQYQMSEIIFSCTDKNLYYTIDTSSGQSGSPILKNNVAYGIHTGANPNSSNLNMGVRITPGLYTVFNNFISECS